MGDVSGTDGIRDGQYRRESRMNDMDEWAIDESVDFSMLEFWLPPPDPVRLFRDWFERATQFGVSEPGALSLATADALGRVSNRIVKMITVTADGLVFTSHTDSRKGRDLAATGWASAVLYWRETNQQVILTGQVHQLPDTESDALWLARAPGTHAMSVASHQSSTLDDEIALRAEAGRLAAAGEPLPRPARWVGYILVPDNVEFWHIGRDRLHLRLLYERVGGHWTNRRLQP